MTVHLRYCVQLLEPLIVRDCTHRPQEREAWSLPTSIFKARSKESDSRAYYDGNSLEVSSRACGNTGT